MVVFNHKEMMEKQYKLIKIKLLHIRIRPLIFQKMLQRPIHNKSKAKITMLIKFH